MNYNQAKKRHLLPNTNNSPFYIPSNHHQALIKPSKTPMLQHQNSAFPYMGDQGCHSENNSDEEDEDDDDDDDDGNFFSIIYNIFKFNYILKKI